LYIIFNNIFRKSGGPGVSGEAVDETGPDPGTSQFYARDPARVVPP